MELYSENENYKLYKGNMLDMLEVIQPETIDSIITDPPYELNFMNKGWDNSGIAFQPNTWKKCYEVLIKLYYELDYRKFKIEDLKEIKGILQQYNKQTREVKVRKIGTKRKG